MNRLVRGVSAFLVACLAAVAPAREGGEPVFAVDTTGGTTAAGPLRKIGEDWSVRLGGDKPALVAGAEMVSLVRQGLLLPPRPVTQQVILGNGDRLPLEAAAPLRVTGDTLECTPHSPLRLPGNQQLHLPVAAVSLLWIAAPDATEEPAVLIRRLLAARRSKDVVLLRNGDQVEGTVTSLDRMCTCRLEAGKKTLEVPFGRVSALAFSTELLARPRTKGPFGHLVIASGARLDLASATVDVDRQILRGKMLLGTAIEVPLDQVVSLYVREGNVVYLSDLEPRAYEHTPYFGIGWPLVKDESVVGAELQLAGSTYDKGLGMHSQSRVSYNLAGKYSWFEAVVGVHATSGQRGRARVKVLVNGKAQDLGLDKEITVRDHPLAIRIDVRTARELTLCVDFGRLGDAQGQVDWANARLIKARP
jgi:hypothetical protein